MHNLLLDLRLLPFQVHQLFLHVVVVSALYLDLLLQVVEVLNNLWVHKLYIFVVESGQMIVHQRNLLSQ